MPLRSGRRGRTRDHDIVEGQAALAAHPGEAGPGGGRAQVKRTARDAQGGRVGSGGKTGDGIDIGERVPEGGRVFLHQKMAGGAFSTPLIQKRKDSGVEKGAVTARSPSASKRRAGEDCSEESGVGIAIPVGVAVGEVPRGRTGRRNRSRRNARRSADKKRGWVWPWERTRWGWRW